jgi:hypothetical protein
MKGISDPFFENFTFPLQFPQKNESDVFAEEGNPFIS